ncbi:MAG: transporter [Rhodocyclaceae bacterium]|nr:MAG: transporter [Rhodocyclaceae bacterium]
MLLGLALLYVGAVLILNGLWMLGRIGDREIPVINLFAGGLSLLVALKLAFGDGADLASVKAAALSLLFSFTYLWVAINRYSGADGRGLGWFSLFVALTAVPVAVDCLRLANSPGEWWLGLSWVAWSILWLLFFLLLALNKPLTRLTACVAIGQGVLTGWVPGYLLLNGNLS